MQSKGGVAVCMVKMLKRAEYLNLAKSFEAEPLIERA